MDIKQIIVDRGAVGAIEYLAAEIEQLKADLGESSQSPTPDAPVGEGEEVGNG